MAGILLLMLPVTLASWMYPFLFYIQVRILYVKHELTEAIIVGKPQNSLFYSWKL